MKRSVVVVQLLVTALFAAVGGFVAVSVSSDGVDADRGGMTAAVPMMTEAQLRVGGASASSDLATTTITPVRILDTRSGAAALAGSKEPWGALETRTVEAAGLGTIPADAVGVVVNVTVLNATAPDTFLTLFPTGTAMPNASTINPQPNEVAFNAATVLLGGDDGTFEIYNYSGTVDVIVDVTAFMTRTLADAVDTVETDVDIVEEEVDEVADDVGQLKSYTAVLIDAEGTQFPLFDYSVRVGNNWFPVSGNGVSATASLYYLSNDCSGEPYGAYEELQTYLRYFDSNLLNQGRVAHISNAGDMALVEYGETHPTLTISDMGSARYRQSQTPAECTTSFYRAASSVTEVSLTTAEGLPVAPATMAIYAS